MRIDALLKEDVKLENVEKLKSIISEFANIDNYEKLGNAIDFDKTEKTIDSIKNFLIRKIDRFEEKIQPKHKVHSYDLKRKELIDNLKDIGMF
ncbi:hypothetical protein MHBO_000554 [Bonamia ostreae]|uniref:Uncharacterized protein n=1 Tax=Bonamia ostreae TaxID=126728 RepID=A0ABV2AG33_9EUKA